jgi:CO dehydrogenase/acetyl-CoA synthase alpha subunit
VFRHGTAIKHTNLYIIGTPKRKGRGKKKKDFEEVIVKNVSNLMKDMNKYSEEHQQIPSRKTSKRCILGHVTVKLLKPKVKEGIVKAAREK